MQPAYSQQSDLRGRVGMVVPAWFPAALPPSQVEQLLLTTLAGCTACVRPEHLVVVTDGCPPAAAGARAVQARLVDESGERFQVLELPENQGKGAALAA